MHRCSLGAKAFEQFLRQEFADILIRGYAECVEEIEIGVSSVAVPIQIRNIGAIYSVAAIGSIRKFSESHRVQIGGKLKTLSDKIAAAIQLFNANDLLPH